MMKKIILPWLMINRYIGIEIEANKEDRDEYFDIKKVKIQTIPKTNA